MKLPLLSITLLSNKGDIFMYLALKEIIHNKLRYLLIVIIIFLISYMIFFMTSLAFGLMRDNRAAADNWKASSVTLSDYANNNLTASFITENQYAGLLDKNNSALGYMFAVTNLKGEDEKVNISLFGQDWDSFIAPKLIKGEYPKNSREIIVDASMENYGVTLGSTIKLNGSKTNYRVVGLTQDSKFFTVPVIYTSLDTYWSLRYGNAPLKTISAIVSQNNGTISKKGLTSISESTMIRHLPGYTPQVNVFAGMIIAMVVITSLIIGIFMYIMVLQKMNLYGVMRAQGIQMKTIVSSLFSQIFILTLIGIVLSLLFLFITKLFLPTTLFFYTNWFSYGILSLAILLMALLGGLFSLHKILKIDPLVAIGEQ